MASKRPIVNTSSASQKQMKKQKTTLAKVVVQVDILDEEEEEEDIPIIAKYTIVILVKSKGISSIQLGSLGPLYNT